MDAQDDEYNFVDLHNYHDSLTDCSCCDYHSMRDYKPHIKIFTILVLIATFASVIACISTINEIHNKLFEVGTQVSCEPISNNSIQNRKNNSIQNNSHIQNISIPLNKSANIQHNKNPIYYKLVCDDNIEALKYVQQPTARCTNYDIILLHCSNKFFTFNVKCNKTRTVITQNGKKQWQIYGTHIIEGEYYSQHYNTNDYTIKKHEIGSYPYFNLFRFIIQKPEHLIVYIDPEFVQMQEKNTNKYKYKAYASISQLL
jgi:hypothetical protein